ncbi:MAG: VWA domain-containing protein [Spirochaetaceae bacterium]|nr:VWA domain-containing protein [Spirochaetaceae bacterium]
MPVFQYPSAFFLLLGIPLIYILRGLGVFSKIAFPLVLSDWQGKPFVWSRPLDKIAKFLSSIFFLIGYISLIIAVADPVTVKQDKIYTSKGTDILFIVDTSPSMMAMDIGGTTRLDVAMQSIKNLVPESGGTSFALVAMASEAALVVPPTTDKEIFFNRLNSLKAGDLGDGTAIGSGIITGVYHLSASFAPKKCIVLITDGENNAGSVHPETAARLAKEKDIGIYVLGIGTRGSVPIEYVDPVSGQVYSGFLDSQFDSTGLEKIASETNGRYFGIETTSSLATALSIITEREQSVQSFYLKNTEKSYYDVFLGITMIAFIVAWVIRRIYLGELI